MLSLAIKGVLSKLKKNIYEVKLSKRKTEKADLKPIISVCP